MKFLDEITMCRAHKAKAKAKHLCCAFAKISITLMTNLNVYPLSAGLLSPRLRLKTFLCVDLATRIQSDGIEFGFGSNRHHCFCASTVIFYYGDINSESNINDNAQYIEREQFSFHREKKREEEEEKCQAILHDWHICCITK